MTNVEEILNYPFITIGDFTLNLYNLLAALLIFALARLLVFAISRVLKRIFIRQKVDTGRQFAVIQFLKYIIYTLTILLALQAIGINLSLLWACLLYTSPSPRD